jgi:hypothetical protein
MIVRSSLATCGFESLNKALPCIKYFILILFNTLWRVLWISFRRDIMLWKVRLTDAFIWEDLPTTDPVTGSLTMAAWIPCIQKFTTILTTTVIAYHFVQTTLRFTTRDDRPFIYGKLYPFDATKRPTYEVINISQVKPSVIRWV